MWSMWRRIRNIVVYRILHADDSPHRIAFGVAIALFVAWTPTIGMQMIIALSLASLLGGNKAVTIPVVWITNPFTAVPLYYANWCFGHLLRRGSLEFDPTVRETLAKLIAKKGSLLTYARNLNDVDWWHELIALIAQCGVDLWIGSLILGFGLALISYPICRWGVIAYRRARHHHEKSNPSDAARADTKGVALDDRPEPAETRPQ